MSCLRRAVCLLLALSILALLLGCGSESAYTQKEIFAMDTVMSFRIYGKAGGDAAAMLGASDVAEVPFLAAEEALW